VKRANPRPLCPICGEPLKRDKRDSFSWHCPVGLAEQRYRLGEPAPGGPHDEARRYAWNNAELKYCRAPGAEALPSSEWAPWASAINVNADGSDHSRTE
jgi:hypothetical protein